jgi:hypothetical protein
MVDWTAYARRIEADLAECRKHLAPLESGEMRIAHVNMAVNGRTPPLQ